MSLPELDGTHVNSDDRVVTRGAVATLAPASPASGLSWFDRNPVATGFLLALLPAVASAIQAALDGEPLRAVLSALVAGALAVFARLIPGRVTPLADAKLGAGLPLVLERAAPDPPKPRTIRKPTTRKKAA